MCLAFRYSQDFLSHLSLLERSGEALVWVTKVTQLVFVLRQKITLIEATLAKCPPILAQGEELHVCFLTEVPKQP